MNHFLRRQLATLHNLFQTVPDLSIVIFYWGYRVTRRLGRNEQECRTLAIAVGMQNSALAVKYISATVVLPGALFSVWYNLSGSRVAAYRKPGR